MSRHDREMTARALSKAAEQGQLDAEDAQDRLDRARQIRTYEELKELLADLPEAQEPEARTIAAQPETLHLTASLLPARRHGHWKAPAQIVASAGMAEVELDFAEAEMPDGQVTVDARPNMSNVDLIVPEGYAVTTEEAAPGAEPVNDRTTGPNAPRVHVRSHPGMGSVIIRHPGKIAR